MLCRKFSREQPLVNIRHMLDPSKSRKTVFLARVQDINDSDTYIFHLMMIALPSVLLFVEKYVVPYS